MPPPLSDDERGRIANEIRRGVPRNEIARSFKRSAATVSKIARQEGLRFDRSQTKAATEARAADFARRLEDLKARLLQEASVALTELHAEAKVFNWHQGEFNEHTLTEPTFGDKRHIQFRLNGAIQYALMIDSHQGGGEDLSLVDKWLDLMAGAEQ